MIVMRCEVLSWRLNLEEDEAFEAIYKQQMDLGPFQKAACQKSEFEPELSLAHWVFGVRTRVKSWFNELRVTVTARYTCARAYKKACQRNADNVIHHGNKQEK